MIHEIPSKIRIMLVDDDPSILQTTATILEEEGYDVLTCRGGKEAVDKFNDTIFGVILDINMPGMSGLDVFEIIKSKNQYVPIIFHTGYAQRENNFLAITITDTGCGIPDTIKNKIFDPLFTTKPKGIGLGLAISSNIIQRHEGSIDLKSKEGEGTSFIIKLPIIKT
ncbi:MAG: hypothetical protein A2Z57_00715 [Planctomycetes bacterium RIFCSPHIGHO2_12_39_6]|nr:MAG: hypothetical protein A2Z57_00715 [Planctomycetes bacterium RIFCSPHIGHO2_12_39_6]